jgi:hypothetical protein
MSTAAKLGARPHGMVSVMGMSDETLESLISQVMTVMPRQYFLVGHSH